MSSYNRDGCETQPLLLRREELASYFNRNLSILPEYYTVLDTSRLTAVYFCVVGLDILGEEKLLSNVKDKVIDYIYAMQLHEKECPNVGHRGFTGSYMGQPYGDCLCFRDTSKFVSSTSASSTSSSSLQCTACPIQGHLAMAYTALATLRTLGDSFDRLNKSSLLKEIRDLQRPNGTFSATLEDGECDMRFLYCACAISYMLDDWSSVDQLAALQFVRDCITYEGGIALVPGAEAHGGSCFCAVASLALMGRLQELGGETLKELTFYCLQRQVGGYQGRTGKDPDSCYSFWIGATLNLLGNFQETDMPSTEGFLLNDCQYSLLGVGGFAKVPGMPPDVLHSFYSTCWLSMAGYDGLRAIDAKLGICSDR